MIIFRHGSKIVSGVKNQISRHQCPLFSNTEVYLHKSFTNTIIPCQGKYINSGIGNFIKHNTFLTTNYVNTNKLNCNYSNNLMKLNLHTSPSYNSFNEYDNQRREKRDANILITLTTTLIIVLILIYGNLDFGEYDVPSKKEEV